MMMLIKGHMPNNNVQSKTDSASITTMCFISAFCRRNLTIDDIRVISAIFDIALDNRMSSLTRKQLIREALQDLKSNVRLSASEATKIMVESALPDSQLRHEWMSDSQERSESHD
jgi:hypothetical protein